MIKFKLKRDIYALSILLVGVIIALWAYPQLPEQLPTHWNIKGEVDGYSNKLSGLGLSFGIALAVYIGFYLQDKIDPLKKNYDRFGKVYFIVRDILITLFILLEFFIIFSSLGYIGSSNRIIFIVLSILMIVMGNYMPTFKRNWFLGIKTPWTVSNEEVWNKTHRLGGKLFIVAGVLGLVESLLLSTNYIFFAGVMVAALGSTIYSYWLYKKLEDN